MAQPANDGGRSETSEPAAPTIPTPETCTDCHATSPDVAGTRWLVDFKPDSVHADFDCTDCHTEMSVDDVDPAAARPHGENVVAVTSGVCGQCHDGAVEAYRSHGRLAVGADPDLPKCWDCHGKHDIVSATSTDSHVHPVHLQQTCQKCHADVNLVKRHDTLRSEPITLYENSVHGKATSMGVYVAATCKDCHSARDAEGNRSSHRILGPGNRDSPVFHFNIPDTCGQCHESVTKDYWDGIHGQYVKRGSVDSPVCTGCHGEHGIIDPSDPRSPVSAAKLAEQTCARCHESEVLNARYGRVRPRDTYVDSYHGLKSQAGDARVANCASCHGSHRILPSSDPKSSINPANIQQTCGACHDHIAAQLATTDIHSLGGGAYTGWEAFFQKLYFVLIAVTIGGMLLHNGGDWLRRVAHTRAKPFVQRFTAGEAGQHWVLMTSFIVLVISGFSLRFSEAFWVKWMFGWDGGFVMRGLIHRAAGVVMFVSMFWHLVYFFTPRGRAWLRDMLPAWSDVRHARENMAFIAGVRDEEPRFKRFSYMEKLEYWAMVWGAILMTVTGVMLWFDNSLVSRWGVPRGLVDVMMVIHYYEAWLAFLAIVVWHLYGVLLKPSVYPMNTSWLTGKMPREMYEEEHADGPALPARTKIVRYAELDAPKTDGAPKRSSSLTKIDETDKEDASAIT